MRFGCLPDRAIPGREDAATIEMDTHTHTRTHTHTQCTKPSAIQPGSN